MKKVIGQHCKKEENLKSSLHNKLKSLCDISLIFLKLTSV